MFNFLKKMTNENNEDVKKEGEETPSGETGAEGTTPEETEEEKSKREGETPPMPDGFGDPKPETGKSTAERRAEARARNKK